MTSKTTYWFLLNSFLKTSTDIFIATFLLLILSPIILVLCLAIKIDSPGPIFYRQQRIGKNLITFRMLKFRSMIVDADTHPEGWFVYANDWRVTKVGHYLRLFSLDEIPQLINVLFGQMALVGPRPPVVNELGETRNFSNKLKSRFSMKPGITGLAQIKGRNSLNWKNKIRYDCVYIEAFQKFGVLVDFCIILKTPFQLLKLREVIEK